MEKNDLEPNAFFTKNGKDIWKLEMYCLEPTVKLVNVETKEEESFGLGGLAADSFHKIKMPKLDKD